MDGIIYKKKNLGSMNGAVWLGKKREKVGKFSLGSWISNNVAIIVAIFSRL